MDQESNKAVFRQFRRSGALFEELGDKAGVFLGSIGSDISLIINDAGLISDVAFRNQDLVGYNCDHWVGKNFRDIVTKESVEKVDALLLDSERQSITRRRQVNHAAKGVPDLPVDYMIVSLAGTGAKIALGNDMRQLAALQRQLVQFQMELEGEYRKIRETEARYRTLFHMSGEAVVVVGDADMKILDSNQAAAVILGRATRKLVGENAAGIFAKADREAALVKLNEVRHRGASESFTARVSGSGADCRIMAEPYRESGHSNLVLRMAALDGDKTEASAGGKGFFSPELVGEAVAVTDASGNIEMVNELFLDLVNCQNRNQVIGRHLRTWLGGSSLDLQVLMSRLQEDRHVRGFATLVRDEIGMDSAVTVSVTRQKGGDGRDRYAFMIVDAVRRQPLLPAQASMHVKEMGDFSELVGRVPLKELIREAADVIEVMCIEAALRQVDNNRAAAAELLGMSRQSLYLKLKRYGLADFGADN